MNPIPFIIRVLLTLAIMHGFLATWTVIARAEPLGDYIKWGVHPSGSIVFHYRMNHQDVFFMHPVTFRGEMPECKGLVNHKAVPECAEYSVRMGGIVLISTDSRVPMIYMVETLPSHVRVNAGEYISLIQATYKGER